MAQQISREVGDATIYCGECLDVMRHLPDHSVDAVICDPPYGTTACKWDAVIPFAPMWHELRRIAKPRAAIVLFASQPFTSALVMSNVEEFKYTWTWRKSRPGGFVNAKLRPLKDTEDICVFSDGYCANGSLNNMPYHPQGLIPSGKGWKRPTRYPGSEGVSPHRESHALERTLEWTNYPRSILDFANPNSDVLHPTQKPLDLMEYLVQTYTNEGDTVLDFAAGSFTTGVACLNTGRVFIGIEREPKYCRVGATRLINTQPRLEVADAAAD